MRNRSLVLGALGALAALAVSGAAFGDDQAAPATGAPPAKAWKLTFKTKVPAPPEGTKRLEAWIPTPFVDEVQSVKDLVVTASVPYGLTKEATYGNRLVHVLVENPKGETTIDWVAVVLARRIAGRARARRRTCT